MSRRQRDKGKRKELEIANMLKDWRPEARRKTSNDHDREDGRDLEGTYPFGIQVKGYKTRQPINRIGEVRRGVPMFIDNADYEKPVAVMYLEDLLPILETIEELAMHHNIYPRDLWCDMYGQRGVE